MYGIPAIVRLKLRLELLHVKQAFKHFYPRQPEIHYSYCELMILIAPRSPTTIFFLILVLLRTRKSNTTCMDGLKLAVISQKNNGALPSVTVDWFLDI